MVLYISRFASRPGCRFKLQHKITILSRTTIPSPPVAITGRGLLRSLLIRAVALRTVAPGTRTDDIFYPGSHGLLMGYINGILCPFSVSIKCVQD